MTGEFGRDPTINKNAGRGQWTNTMSMALAGGGLRHGLVIGATNRKGYCILERKVTARDLAATAFRHLDIGLEVQWLNPRDRPISIVVQNGRPIAELF